jgi:hypothetical protein
MLGNSHLNVILDGWTSYGSKAVKDPGTDSLVAKIPEMGNDLLSMVCKVPALVNTVNVQFRNGLSLPMVIELTLVIFEVNLREIEKYQYYIEIIKEGYNDDIVTIKVLLL